MAPQQGYPTRTREVRTKWYLCIAPIFLQNYERDTDNRTDDRRGQYDDKYHFPANPGSEQRKQLKITVTHAFLTGDEFKNDKNAPQAHVASHGTNDTGF